MLIYFLMKFVSEDIIFLLNTLLALEDTARLILEKINCLATKKSNKDSKAISERWQILVYKKGLSWLTICLNSMQRAQLAILFLFLLIETYN